MTGPYGTADWRQPLTDFERAAGVKDPVTPSDHANALAKRLAEVLTPTCTATSFSAPHAFDGSPFDNSDNDWELCDKPADDPIHTSRPGASGPGFIEAPAANAIVFPHHVGKLQAEAALADFHRRNDIRRQIVDRVSSFAGWRVAEVIPLAEDDYTIDGNFVIGMEHSGGGRAFKTFRHGKVDHRQWPTLAAALVHLAAQMIDPAGRGDDGRAAEYALRMFGHPDE